MTDALHYDAASEQQLLARIARGDADAFSVLVKPYTIVLLRYAFGLTQEKSTAEDIVQDVLRWAWEHRATLNIRGTMRSYLLSAVHNRALNNIRSASAEARHTAHYVHADTIPGMGSPALSPDTLTERRALQTAVYDAIASLPERRRQVLMLRYQELSYPEIAQILGVSINTVETQARLGFATLRETLAPWANQKNRKKT